MNFQSLRLKYACVRGTVAASALIRLLGAIVPLLAICSAGGCIATRVKGTSNRPVTAGMEVFVHASIAQHAMDRICIFPFISPPEMVAASSTLTAAFQARLIQIGPFREVRALPYQVKSDSEALWYARSEGYSLAMCPQLLYMTEGTGAMPTELVVRSRILDARTGQVLWDVKQEARSEPGYDIDLTWNTINGEPAQRYRVMADCLAKRLAEYLAQPPGKEN